VKVESTAIWRARFTESEVAPMMALAVTVLLLAMVSAPPAAAPVKFCATV